MPRTVGSFDGLVCHLKPSACLCICTKEEGTLARHASPVTPTSNKLDEQHCMKDGLDQEGPAATVASILIHGDFFFGGGCILRSLTYRNYLHLPCPRGRTWKGRHVHIHMGQHLQNGTPPEAGPQCGSMVLHGGRYTIDSFWVDRQPARVGINSGITMMQPISPRCPKPPVGKEKELTPSSLWDIQLYYFFCVFRRVGSTRSRKSNVKIFFYIFLCHYNLQSYVYLQL